MKVKKLILGFFNVNCYIVYGGKVSFIIDPGADADKVINTLKNENIKPDFILNTHGHYDHIGAVPELVDYFKIPFYIHPGDELIIRSPEKNFSSIFSGNPLSLTTYNLINNEVIEFLNNNDIKVFNMPGHTPGSIVILTGNYLFTGDLLFRGGIGRTDLYGGDYDMIVKSLKKLNEFDKNLLVFPGHGASTNLAWELENNYFLKSIL